MFARRIILLLSAVTLCRVSLEAVSFAIGECPSGHVPGDTWGSEGACELCECHDDRFVCTSCGVYSILLDPNRCYHYRDMSKEYPGCCNPIIKCRGDPGFNETMLANQ
ncbi:hypothetical protein Btru_076790 [Bulinus truncatus]|nr:hypothetical protein Btru_076790 [Bulinus truncatus]